MKFSTRGDKEGKFFPLLILLIPNMFFIYLLNLNYLFSSSLLDFSGLLFVVIFIFWLMGVMSGNIELIVLSYIFSSITIFSLYGFDHLIIIYTISAVLVVFITGSISPLIWQKAEVKMLYSYRSFLISIILVSIIVAMYLGLSIVIANIVNNVYDVILATTPSLFQVVYMVFIKTRIGALIFVVVFILITYYLLKNYVRDVIIDIFLIRREHVSSRIRYLIENELNDTLNFKDFFSKYFFRTILFFIMYFMYGFLYPILKLFLPYKSLPLYTLWFALWFFSSLLIYMIMKRIIRRLFEKPYTPEKPRLSYMGLVFSSLLLIAYILALTIYAPNHLVDVTMKALGIEQTSKTVNNGFLDFINKSYIWFSDNLYSGMESYVEYLIEAYGFLEDVITDLFKLLWGG